jgi:CheY-like chemotaxis protein
LKILHLEDSLVHLDTVRELIARAHPDWQLTQVSRMSAAEEAYNLGHFDVVVCDPRLEHDEDGLDFALNLHQTGQPVIITSAYSYNQRPGIIFVPKQNMRAELVAAITAAALLADHAVPVPVRR